MLFDVVCKDGAFTNIDNLLEEHSFLDIDEDLYRDFKETINDLLHRAINTGQPQMYDTGISSVFYIAHPNGSLGAYSSIANYTLHTSLDIEAARANPNRFGMQLEIITEEGGSFLSPLGSNQDMQEFAKRYSDHKMNLWRVEGNVRQPTVTKWFREFLTE